MDESKEQRLREIYSLLTYAQRRFVQARLEYASIKDAAESIGISPKTAYGWKKRDIIDEAVELLREDVVSSTVALLKSALFEAAIVKMEGLRDEDGRIRQSASSDIMDRILGKATQPLKHSGEIDVKKLSDDELRALLESEG